MNSKRAKRLDEPPKILQVISSFVPAYSYGGALRVAFSISKELVKKGHEVTVYTTDAFDSVSRLSYQKNPEIMEGIKVYRFRNISNTLSKKNFSCAPMMFLFFKNTLRKFDIIHFHEYRTFQAVFAYYYAKKNQIPYVVQAHGAVLPVFEKEGLKKLFDIFWGKRILKNASKIIAVSDIEKIQYLRMGVPEPKIEVIPNGIDPSDYEILPVQGIFRKKYGIAHNEKVILYLGRLHKRKGIDFLINAFSCLLSQNIPAKLVIAGPDDGYLGSLEKLVKELRIETRIIFTGTLSEQGKLQAFIDSDLLVYPGLFEIFGLVPFEAIMCGTPVIVSDDCGCGDIIEKGQFGSTVTYGDVPGLCAKMIEIINDPSSAQEKVRLGQTYIRERLIWEKNILSYMNIYEEHI